ncbi:hypothetical protein [Aliarcobacter cryaerophilus]|jgi:hypothetical protein|uniref:Uncharacterized protein n=4 Tax=Arcobacteraceae TaxID=2808963 RepID=A0AA96I030_9BACT|nr:hypothetical protein [Aliarcobacter cryaerophilus]WNL12932.1 hypothetical protein RJG52_02450 [Arcobacter sp. AZ-2023]WPD09420.1 hypothetical protein QUR77_09420 [Arcobacter sp. DSM 115954]MCT7462152.1 hypothetical protein [Aliarcobacter cryaerophilus]MCT7484364.1 hypothetical protein [Aliarcobacter cryaerophilus]MCT7493232.1 hypothetical protein [Aliarcobacter cryaerophilus]
MNVIKKLFTDLESLLSLLVDFDYSKLILLAIILSIIYLINNIILNKYYKPGINKTKIELKKINLEAALYKKRKYLLKTYLILFIIISFFVISKNNLSIIIPILSAFILISLFSMKEQLNNMFLGFSYKSAISTTIYEGMEFYFKNKPNEICKVTKVNLFKTIYKNEMSGQLFSLENKALNELEIIHKVVKDLDYVEFKYIVKSDYPFEEYVKETKEKLNNYINIIEVDFKTLRETILSLKSKYNSTPFLKPFYKIDIEFDTKEDVIIKLKLTTYKYNYNNYLDDFLKFRPKVINQINNDLNNIYKEV